ncbi:MAG TPA: low molecular weight protein-tyrosine-phosphatase, partial [Bacteroidia bacterium]|nr:low molecular weight protein-tyrosine-phosphatase [Bacteroidia bacterium]
SAGTASYHVGAHPDQRSIKNARSHGFDISGLRARKFTIGDFDRFDHIYVMDSSNYRDVISLARNKSDEEKVELLLNKKWPGKNMAVPDPYYEGPDGFETVFRLVEQACAEIVKEVVGDK